MRCSAGHEICDSGAGIQSRGSVPRTKRQSGSGATTRSAVSPWLVAQDAKNAARRCETIRASLQGHPATRQARRPGRSVAGWRSSCWMSITLLTPFPGRSRFPGSLVKPYVRADCRCIGLPPVLAMTFDVSPAKSFRRARRATVLAGYDEAAPEGGRHRFEEEPPARVEETRAMLVDVRYERPPGGRLQSAVARASPPSSPGPTELKRGEIEDEQRSQCHDQGPERVHSLLPRYSADAVIGSSPSPEVVAIVRW